MTIRTFRHTRFILRLKPEPVAKMSKRTPDRRGFPVLEGILGVDSLRVVSEVRCCVARRLAKGSFHLGRPNQILAFDAPGGHDPNQLPAVRAANATGIIPGSTQEALYLLLFAFN
jgi:hypothetical protein